MFAFRLTFKEKTRNITIEVISLFSELRPGARPNSSGGPGQARSLQAQRGEEVVRSPNLLVQGEAGRPVLNHILQQRLKPRVRTNAGALPLTDSHKHAGGLMQPPPSIPKISQGGAKVLQSLRKGMGQLQHTPKQQQEPCLSAPTCESQHLWHQPLPTPSH
jgi:hypothetical protein